jgi:hypothetical protein
MTGFARFAALLRKILNQKRLKLHKLRKKLKKR